MMASAYTPTPSGVVMVADEKDYSTSQIAQMFLSGADVYPGRGVSGPTDPFRQVNWVYACVTALASAAGRVPMRLSRGAATGTKSAHGLARVRWGVPHGRKCRREKDAVYRADEGDIVESGPLHDLLEKPNANQRFNEFMEVSVGLLYTHGRVHWLFDEMVGRRPVSMYAVGGKKTKPIFDRSGRVKKLVGWEFVGEEGRRFNVGVDECITFQMFDPEDPHAGLAPLVPGRLAIMSYYNADLYNASMFSNGCEPGPVLSTDAQFDPVEDRQIYSTWMQRHGGASNARSLAILWGGMKVDSLANNMEEMQYIEGSRMKREDICATFRVPPSVAGFLGTTGDASAYVDAEAERFWQDTAAPLVNKFAQAIDSELCPRFEGGLEAWADVEEVPIYQKLRRAQTDAVVKFFAMGVPMADLNDCWNLGLPDQPWYKTGFLPMALLPAQQAAEGNVLPDVPAGPTAPGNDDLDLPAEEPVAQPPPAESAYPQSRAA
ncbi:MAG: phage portal protein, partial [Phycisphaerae bacterium]|nr:phage portal protein [Phycisphaerae bacterium]